MVLKLAVCARVIPALAPGAAGAASFEAAAEASPNRPPVAVAGAAGVLVVFAPNRLVAAVITRMRTER